MKEDEVDRYFDESHLNIGVLTGSPSGNILVLDLDVTPWGKLQWHGITQYPWGDTEWESLTIDDQKKHKENKFLFDYECKYGHLDHNVNGAGSSINTWQKWLDKYNEGQPLTTPTSITGSGGMQVFVRLPNGVQLTQSAKHIHPSMDTRTTGGQVVVSPSIHPNGQSYKWLITPDIPVIDCPEWLLAKLQGSNWRDEFRTDDTPINYSGNTISDDYMESLWKSRHRGHSVKKLVESDVPIKSGQGRKKVLCSIAGWWSSQGLSGEDLIKKVLPHLSRMETDPADPVDEKRVRNICRWVDTKNSGKGSKKKTKGDSDANQDSLIYEQDGKYYRKSSNRYDECISDFVIRLNFPILYKEDGREYWYQNVTLISAEHPNEPKTVEIPPDAWNSPAKFRSTYGNNKWFNFWGNEKDLQHIGRLLGSKNTLMRRGYINNGLVKAGNRWIYIEDDRAIAADGVVDDICKIGDKENKTHILHNEDITKQELEDILKHLTLFNAPEVTYPVVGWMLNCFLKERFRNKYNRNPILFGTGGSNCGKTATMELFLQNLFSSPEFDAPICADTTPFTIDKALSSTNIVPAFFDEYKFTPRQIEKKDLISSMLRAVYQHKVALRGRSDQGQNKYPLVAPVIIMGEMGTTETAHQHRIIRVFFTNKGKEQGREHFMALKTLPLNKLGTSFLKYVLSLSDKELLKHYNFVNLHTSKEITDRVRGNLILIKTAWQVFILFCVQKMGIDSHHMSTIYEGLTHIDAITLETQHEGQVSLIDKTMQLIAHMIADGHLKMKYHYLIDETEKHQYFCFRFEELYHQYSTQFWRYEGDYEKLDKITFQKQLKEADYYVDSGERYYFDMHFKPGQTDEGVRCRAWRLDLSRMEHLDVKFDTKYRNYQQLVSDTQNQGGQQVVSTGQTPDHPDQEEEEIQW